MHVAAVLQVKNLLWAVGLTSAPRRPSVLTAQCLSLGVGSAAPRACFFFPPFVDEAQEAEAIRILTSILKIRELTSDKSPQKTIFVLKTLVMLYYLMMNSSKASFLRKAACLK